LAFKNDLDLQRQRCGVADGREDTRSKDRTSTKYASKKAATERIAAARDAELRAVRRRKLLITGTAVVAVLAVVVTLVMVGIAQQHAKTKAKAAPVPGVVSYPGLSRLHVTTKVTYAQTPPVGGNHSAQLLNCGVYTTAVPNENAVHDLEHGAVWITYQPNLPADQVAQIAKLAMAPPIVGGSRFVTVSPYPALPSPVVASAWGVQLKLNSAFDTRLADFIARYRIGPLSQAPELGSGCTGGIGTPSQQ
jgi:hypothetical protein